jgi:LacI family transcriptional regulator
MQDIATAAGVSLKTVSRVVNEQADVHPETAAKVRRAIDAMGFRRNELARSLVRGQKASTIGLIVGDLTNPFFAGIAKVVDRLASDRGVAVFITSTDENPERERQLFEALAGRRVDGLLMVPTDGQQQYVLTELVRGTPVVFVDRYPNGVQGDAVTLDNFGGAQLAVNHMLERGHRRVGILAAPSFYTTHQRLLGYRSALTLAGVPIEERLVQHLPDGSVAAAEAAMHRLLDLAEPPTAVFTTTSFMTVGALRVLAQRGAQMSMVGFDDLAYVDLLVRPVSVVAYDPEDLGRQAAALLFRRLDGDSGPAQHVVLPPTFIDRHSVEPLAGKAPL